MLLSVYYLDLASHRNFDLKSSLTVSTFWSDFVGACLARSCDMAVAFSECSIVNFRLPNATQLSWTIQPFLSFEKACLAYQYLKTLIFIGKTFSLVCEICYAKISCLCYSNNWKPTFVKDLSCCWEHVHCIQLLYS